ncbi:prenyltransferase/squalene oxidase repeat-containing protein [Stratiformator vulcanicus]|uniref:Squalene cyclase C-terminal domain-containing protein n=1 Tax=Stratiformator vulcanicus TaxID=2527980 RepID=A0A517QZD6_9PLAN|nr:prenyltransferase/squalene oxidase repeat-containing protein [Stratiformator vulcanicus]QDT36964.1 hypothetical protein Pan189_13280 [Stratiformator vulcanicus]
MLLRAVTVFVVVAASRFLPAAELGPDLDELQQSRQQGIEFLRLSQNEDGGWTAPRMVGITGVCTVALLDSGLSADDETVARALSYLKSYRQKDGGIYHPDSSHRNYETCLSVLAFEKANADGLYSKMIEGAENFLRGLQWDEGEGIESTDSDYGGAGYGGHKRPDLSNTQFFLEALKAAGVKEDDPAMQKALIFVSRTQNLESQHNTTANASKIDDGGFFYTAAGEGETKAGTTDNGGLRSYGSMTYAGLKSMIYAGLSKDDPRVSAALEWIKNHYTLNENPNMGKQGLFYYYQTFAKTLEVLEVDRLEDASGVKHDWRKDLAEKLFDLQKPNGSWVNEADRWYEGDPNIVTGYALLALNRCRAK